VAQRHSGSVGVGVVGALAQAEGWARLVHCPPEPGGMKTDRIRTDITYIIFCFYIFVRI
jgi:hypothetical protein